MINQIKTFFSSRARKAWAGGVAGATIAFWAAVGDGQITGDEVAKIAGGFVAGALVVFITPNAVVSAGRG